MGTVFVLTLFLIASTRVESKFKSLHCNVYDQKVGEFPICRIKALNRYRNTISVTYRTKKYQDKIMASFGKFITLNDRLVKLIRTRFDWSFLRGPTAGDPFCTTLRLTYAIFWTNATTFSQTLHILTWNRT